MAACVCPCCGQPKVPVNPYTEPCRCAPAPRQSPPATCVCTSCNQPATPRSSMCESCINGGCVWMPDIPCSGCGAPARFIGKGLYECTMDCKDKVPASPPVLEVPLPDAVAEVFEDIERMGGKITHVGGPLPDGSGFATASFPLPKNHWLTAAGYNVPPMPWRVGVGDVRARLAEFIRGAAKYAIRASTMNGAETDFDPDAMVQNFVVGMLGYWTDDGRSSDAAPATQKGGE